MTIATTANKSIFLGDGSTTSFSFSWVSGGDPDNLTVTLTDSDGVETLLSPSVYTLALNAILPGALWALGGTLTYPLTGSPLALGSTLTLLRELPEIQDQSLSNQSAFYAQTAETMTDYSVLLIQDLQELFGRAISVPASDEDPPDPLPAAAARANKALIFDSTGQPTAGDFTSSGVAVSAAMIPVVEAATLASARTLMGLGDMAVEDIGSGLADDGSGAVRVITPTVVVATPQTVDTTYDRKVYVANAAVTFTLPLTSTTWNGFGFFVLAVGGAVTITPNAAEAIVNYGAGAAGASLIVPLGCRARIWSTGGGGWYAEVTPVINFPIGYGPSLANGTIVESHSASALTVAIKTALGNDPSPLDPVFFVFRSATAGNGDYTVLAVQAALSITAASGASFGTSNNVAFRLWLVAFNDGGTVRLGLMNCLSGTSVYPLGQSPRASSTQISAGATSAQVFYTFGAAVATKPYALLGYLTWNSGLATAGAWSASPTVIQLFSANIPLPGMPIQVQENATGSVATGTTVFIDSDAVPLITQGDQYLSQAITPVSAANVLQIESQAELTNSAGTVLIGTALFQDATASALAASRGSIAAAASMMVSRIRHKMLAGTASSTTFRVRGGSATAGTTTFNGSAGARKWGGALNSFLSVTEYQG